MSAPPPEPAGQPWSGPSVDPVHVPMTRVVGIGMIVWGAVLLGTLLVPALRTGDRAWWPWCAAAGIGLGALGLAYLSRGRGNASGA